MFRKYLSVFGFLLVFASSCVQQGPRSLGLMVTNSALLCFILFLFFTTFCVADDLSCSPKLFSVSLSTRDAVCGDPGSITFTGTSKIHDVEDSHVSYINIFLSLNSLISPHFQHPQSSSYYVILFSLFPLSLAN